MRRDAPALSALAVTAALLLPSCSTGTSPTDVAVPAAASPTASAPTASAAAAPTTAAPSATPSASPTAPAAQQLSITVADGKVTGDTGTVSVTRGRPVRLTVTSDVADEVHVHGADVSKDVEAGGTVVMEFVQDAPGRFEVELEGRKLVLARLQVR